MLGLYLAAVFQVKHYLADYIFQTPWMIKKFAPGNQWIVPMAVHCLVHFVFTASIASFYVPVSYALALGYIDFMIHFVMDRIKVHPKLLGRWKALDADSYVVAKRYDDKKRLKSNQFFWYALGFDQMIHHLTDLLIIYFILVY